MADSLHVMLLAAYMVTHHFPGMERFPYSLEVMPGTHTLTYTPSVRLIP